MKKPISSLLICFLCLSLPVLGQQLVPIDILGLFDQIPAPPSTVLEAYGRAGCEPDKRCDLTKAYGPVEAQLSGVEKKIELAQVKYSTAAQPGGDPLQGMSPEEFQKKLESMSQDERVRFAMAYSQQRSVALVPEPATVQAALVELQKLRQQGALADPFKEKFIQLQAQIEQKHNEISQWATDNISVGSDGVPGPEWLPVNIEAMKKHIVAEDNYRRSLLIAYHKEVERQKALFFPFQQKLAAIGYGEEAANAKSKSDLLTGQQMMLDIAKRLFAASHGATKSGAQWWKDKLNLDRNLGPGGE